MRSNRETMLRRVCRLLIFFAGLHSSLVTSLRKYFCSSCLRSRLKRSCGICVVCFYALNPGNGLSFPRMEWKEMGIVQGCTFFFFDSCFTFFESCIRLNVLGFVVLYLRI